MDQQSPPKRMTRARAAAKGTDPSAAAIKSTRIVTAAAKAKAAPRTASSTAGPASTTTTSTKRKLRSDEADHDDDDELGTMEPSRETVRTTRATRGRLKKAAATEPAPTKDDEVAASVPVRSTRGRPAKKLAQAVAKDDAALESASASAPTPAPAPAPATEPSYARATRTTRAKKASQDHVPEEPSAAAAAPKPATRAARSTTTTKAAVKKTVKFEEPEKENMIPSAATKGKTTAGKAAATAPAPEPAATGLRARPVRRTAAATTTTTGRATRGTAKTTTATSAPQEQQQEEDKQPKPLSPKKITQMARPSSRDVESDDELASSDKTPIMRPLMRSPVRPAASSSTRPVEKEEAEQHLAPPPAVHADGALLLNRPELSLPGMSSPARRPAPSPFKDALKSPARRGVGVPVLLGHQSKDDNNASGQETAQSPLKASLLCSPAKRPKSPVKGQHGGGSASFGGEIGRSPMKTSLLSSPAKRLFSPAKKFQSVQQQQLQQDEEHERDQDRDQDQDVLSLNRSPAANPLLLIAPVAPGPGGIDAHIEAEVDIDIDANAEVELELVEEAQLSDSPAMMRFPGRLSAVLPRHADPAMKDNMLTAGEAAEEGLVQGETAVPESAADAHPSEDDPEPMDVDCAEPATAGAVTQQQTHVFGSFDLRRRDMDLDLYRGGESDSEDELGSGSPFAALPETPCRIPASRRAMGRPSMGATFSSKSTAKKLGSVGGGGGSFGFTPLADQLNGWRASSPLKVGLQQPDASVLDGPMGSGSEGEKGAALVFMASEHSVSAFGVAARDSPMKSTFFDDEMSVRSPAVAAQDEQVAAEAATVVAKAEPMEHEDAGEDEVMAPLDMEVVEPEMDDISITKEDLDLAAEANEMSLLEPSKLEEVLSAQAMEQQQQHDDDSASEASQEYGDENETPIDPALTMGLSAMGSSSPGVPPVTPQRLTATRTFHTVSKVPLKPADESTPRDVSRRRHSISRLPTARNTTAASSSRSPGKGARPTHGLTRNATVISYSPSKRDTREENPFFSLDAQLQEQHFSESAPSTPAAAGPQPHPPMTPTQAYEAGEAQDDNDDGQEGAGSSWSTAATPARTPRREVDPALLRGAVVFVDVHTSEGADASGIFVELLSQMGARCVKSWPWNPASPPPKEAAAGGGSGGGSGSSARVGITHVVYKDGGKRTLEKVRESGGVVQCVGVSWVLDCEREGKWVDEGPYYIDTSLVPRGGARRRKSMEPRALANLNGTLVSSPIKGSSGNSHGGTAQPQPPTRECQTAPCTPANNNNKKNSSSNDGAGGSGSRSGGRRDSGLWMRTPEDDIVESSRFYGGHDDGCGAQDENDKGAGGLDWDFAALTPVPKTPAPEAVADFAANATPETPSGATEYGDYYYYYSSTSGRPALAPMTCPPKPSSAPADAAAGGSDYRELGAGLLARDKDEGVLMRLMAARRKSLQFAPKVGSPLAKAWP